MLYEIKHWNDGSVIARQQADSLKSALELLVRRDAVLSGAVLRGADLRGADLRGKEFYSVPDLHTKMLDAIAKGALDMAAWHTCETTHCRAGWAVVLAGDCGRLLEAQMGTAAAGAFIHLASCPWMEKVPDFYASTEVALADIQACAEREQQEAAQV